MFAVMRDNDIFQNDKLQSHDRNLVAIFECYSVAFEYIKNISLDNSADELFNCTIVLDENGDMGRTIEIFKTPKVTRTMGVHNERITYFVQDAILNPKS